MKVIFISSCYAKGTESLIRSKCRGKVGVQNAPNAFQWSVIKGLYDNGADFEVVSFPLLPIFPIRFKRPFSPRGVINYQSKIIGEMYSYCSVIGIKPFSIKYRLRNVIEEKLKSRKADEKTVLLLFTTNSFYTDAVIPLLKKYNNVSIVPIITDLIDDAFNFESNQTFLKRIQIKQEIRKQKASYKFFDKFILLTKAMEEKIPEAVGRNIIIEGVCDKTYTTPTNQKKESEIKIILYTGTLQKYVGIDDFVDAFCKTSNPNYRLVICGAGPSEAYINKKASEDNRIIYRGVVSREEAVSLQEGSSLLVNPRKPIESITRYSFPSKTIEYLSSGTPMIGYKLEGIPEEYYQYFYIPDNLSSESMARLIETVLDKPVAELHKKAVKAKDFVIKQKSSQKQVKKILDFLSEK